MRNLKSPLNRYTGSKRLHKEKLWDGQPAEAIIEPFAGAGHHSFYRGSQSTKPKEVFWGEADVSVRAVYETWLNPSCHDTFYQRLELWKLYFLGDRDEAWDALKFIWEMYATAPDYTVDLNDTARFAAASIALRTLTFGGMARTNKSDRTKLNIKYVRCQLEQLRNLNYKFPPLPPFEVSLFDDWREAISAFKRSNLNSAEVLIDPPYWVPKTCKGITACYPGHDPYGQAEFGMFVEAFRECLADERIRLINITGYHSPQLHDALQAVAADAGHNLTLKTNGKLERMQNSKKTNAKNTEAIWTVNRPLPTLFAIAA